MDLSDKTLEQVSWLYGEGFITVEEARAYVELWNAGPHFTRAVIRSNYIANVEVE